MNYIENIYICLAAPVLVAILTMHSKARRMILFLLGGMTASLLSAYISTFISTVVDASLLTASMTIAPFVEEIMKLLPLLFYLLVFEPEKEVIPGCSVMTAIGFATFENVCYLTQNDTANVLFLGIRGFGTGAMHVVCGMIISIGLLHLWDRIWLRRAGTFGLISLVITYHGIYNMLVSLTGTAALIGYLIPVLTAISSIILQSDLRRIPRS